MSVRPLEPCIELKLVNKAFNPPLCRRCDGPLDVEEQMPAGSERFATDDVCRLCVVDEMDIRGAR